jgi:hypothetical protein
METVTNTTPWTGLSLASEGNATALAEKVCERSCHQLRPPPPHGRGRVLAVCHVPCVGDSGIVPSGERLYDRGRESRRLRTGRNEPHHRAMSLFEESVYKVVARHDWYAGEPRLVDREAVRFVVARVAEDVGDAEPVADAALGGQQMDLRADDRRRRRSPITRSSRVGILSPQPPRAASNA